MSQFEQVEDYLTNRLDDGARQAFVQRMENDAQLRTEVELQKQIIEGVKSARAAELKAMLNNVPIGGASSAATGKIALATISVGIVGTLLYFGLRTTPNEEAAVQPEVSSIEQPTTPEKEVENQITESQEPATAEEVQTKSEVVQKPKDEASGVRRLKSAEVVSPRIQVLDLSEDMKSNTEKAVAPPTPASKPTVSASSVEVELDNTQKAYSFHYQFKNDKLLLYGPFDSSLYEVIEINGGVHTLFLFYKNSYYHLDESVNTIEPLIMIRDQELLDKLEKYRNGN
ncbi:MAG: hypothetical protein RIA63_07465 [Cyclobacteriaceae bacterium]